MVIVAAITTKDEQFSAVCNDAAEAGMIARDLSSQSDMYRKDTIEVLYMDMSPVFSATRPSATNLGMC